MNTLKIVFLMTFLTVLLVAAGQFTFGSQGDREGGGGGLVGILAILFAPVAAAIVQAMISRQAEFRADASGAALSGHPLALASAHRKLEAASQRIPMAGSPATSHLFIVNPFAGGLARLFSTHPPTEERIARLEAMARGELRPSEQGAQAARPTSGRVRETRLTGFPGTSCCPFP